MPTVVESKANRPPHESDVKVAMETNMLSLSKAFPNLSLKARAVISTAPSRRIQPPRAAKTKVDYGPKNLSVAQTYLPSQDLAVLPQFGRRSHIDAKELRPEPEKRVLRQQLQPEPFSVKGETFAADYEVDIFQYYHQLEVKNRPPLPLWFPSERFTDQVIRAGRPRC